jgi:hypothetical protein
VPIIVGFPEFQEQVVQRHTVFFETISALQKALNDLTGEAHESIAAEHHLILNLGILAGVSMMEIILLAVNGFGPGAIKAARSLLEASVTAEYLRLQPHHYEDFVEFHHVEKFKEIAFLKEYLPEAYASLEPEFVRAIENEMTRVKDRFGNRRSWCKHDLAEQAKQADYLQSYKLVQPIGSGFVHISPYGLMKRFDREDQFRIEVPPSLNWVEQSLVSGHVLCLGMVHTLIQCFHPELESTLFAELEKDCRRAWPPK